MRMIAALMAWLMGAGGAVLSAQGPDLSRHFAGIEGTFVLLDGTTGAYTRHNPPRAARRFAPCSTFKIPNAAIAIETGVADSPAFTLRYDPALKIENPVWAQDHTLQSAFKVSTVWYYREIARRVGAERMARFLKQFGYGNQDISGGIDQFWLGSSLRISPDEQVQFLQRLRDDRLGLSKRTSRLMRDVMLADEGPGWTLRAKTGACDSDPGSVALWYVGYVERGTRVWYFALELGAPEFEPLLSQRVTKARAILTDLGVLP